MVADCKRDFDGPEYSYIDINETKLVRKTLCQDRDCNVVLREEYQVEELVNVDTDASLASAGADAAHVLEALQSDLRECDEQSRVVTEIEAVELSHNDLHDETFSILYEYAPQDTAFLMYFKRYRETETETNSKLL